MHELSIAEGIVNILHDQMRLHRLSKLERVELRIGALRGIEVASLRWSFDVLAAGSSLEGARLDIDEVPIRGRCAQCGRRLTLEHWTDDCPFCSSSQVEILSGKELDIVAIEGE
jgi:hydrogenase nickel incorporation protein HypA/HybF